MRKIIGAGVAAVGLSLLTLTPSAQAGCGLSEPSEGETVVDEPARVTYAGSPDDGGGFVGVSGDRGNVEAGGSTEDGVYVGGQAVRTVHGEVAASPDGPEACVNDYDVPSTNDLPG